MDFMATSAMKGTRSFSHSYKLGAHKSIYMGYNNPSETHLFSAIYRGPIFHSIYYNDRGTGAHLVDSTHQPKTLRQIVSIQDWCWFFWPVSDLAVFLRGAGKDMKPTKGGVVL